MDEVLIEKAKALIESQISWGDSQEWKNQDFVALSEKIQNETGVAISHVTLKRIWGKVKYESLPNTHTLNTLVQFLGYENWREFKQKDKDGGRTATTLINPLQNELIKSKPKNFSIKSSMTSARVWIGLDFIVMVAILSFFIRSNATPKQELLNPAEFSFSSKKVVSQGVPNSVIFDYDASTAPGEEIFIQQSWDKRLRTKVSKDLHQYTSIYYYPDFYSAKLVVNNTIIKQHKLFITSDGWLPIVARSPVPVYFKKEDVMINGNMTLPIDKIEAKHIDLQPVAPKVFFANVRDFGEIYTDNFTFETSLRNDYREGTAACQQTMIYLVCEGTAITIPLCAKGCVSDIELLLTKHSISGKNTDLSSFGVDFTEFALARIESKEGVTKVFINNKEVYQLSKPLIKAKIVGIYFLFNGSGSVDFVKLQSDSATYEDQF